MKVKLTSNDQKITTSVHIQQIIKNCKWIVFSKELTYQFDKVINVRIFILQRIV